MATTKAEAAALAYHAIHEQMETFTPYADRLRYAIDVIEILREMAETEYGQYIDSQQAAKAKAVE